MKLIIASSVPHLADAIERKGKYDVVAKITNIADLSFSMNREIDCLLVTEKVEVRQNLTDDLIRIKNEYPLLRIVYLGASELNNEYNIRQSYEFYNNGIYDLYYHRNVQLNDIIDLLDHPRSKGSCSHIVEKYKALNNSQKNRNVGVVEDAIEDLSRNNVYVFTSAKPGTGKSFIASNVAATIAKYGKKPDGSNPKVLLVEGDLQNLSVSTLFGIQNKYHNLSLCLNAVQQFMEEHSVDDWNSAQSMDVKNEIKLSCVNSGVLNNLDIIESHDFSFDDFQSVDPSAYYYLVDYLSTLYDVVIVDGNTSIQHKTTDPLYQLSHTLYFVFTTEYSNLQRNIEFANFLKSINVAHKVKYILNKTLTDKDHKMPFTDDELIDDHFTVNYRVPMIDFSVIYNATYNHKPIAVEKNFATLPARLTFLKIANDIVRLQNLKEIMNEVDDLKKEVSKK